MNYFDIQCSHFCSGTSLMFLTLMVVYTLKAIYAIRDGLNDPLVRTGHRLSLHQRATRMKESASFKKHRLLLRDLPPFPINSVTQVLYAYPLFSKELFGSK